MNSRFVLGHDCDKMDTSHLRSSLDVLEFNVGNFRCGDAGLHGI